MFQKYQKKLKAGIVQKSNIYIFKSELVFAHYFYLKKNMWILQIIASLEIKQQQKH